MATLGTQVSPTGRDRAHEDLGVLRANFQALLARRGVANYDTFLADLSRLNGEIQTLRTGNPADLMARGGVEAARQDMERFFNQFIARVESTPQGILAIAQAINPNINIPAFERSPARELGQQANQQTIQALREGNGPFDALRIAVEQSQNTDLYVLFSLYAAARTTVQNAQHPGQAQANEARIQGLEQQRAYLTRVNDELVGAHRLFDQQETAAARRTWLSRGVTTVAGGIAGATMALMMNGTKAPTAATAVVSATPAVNVTVNVGNTITLGHAITKDAQGNLILTPTAADKASTINGVAFQFNGVTVGSNEVISGKLNYQLPGKPTASIDVHAGENALSDGTKIALKRVGDKLQVTYQGTTVNY